AQQMPTMPAPRTATSHRIFSLYPLGEFFDVHDDALVRTVADRLLFVLYLGLERDRSSVHLLDSNRSDDLHADRRGRDMPHVDASAERLVARRQVAVERLERGCLDQVDHHGRGEDVHLPAADARGGVLFAYHKGSLAGDARPNLRRK